MILLLVREIYTENSTIGKLYIEGNFECYTLEDTCREKKIYKEPFDISYEKIEGKTAIPFGSYEIIIDMSSRFKKEMPRLVAVPGFKGIRIHSGNKSEDTEGCILVGLTNPKPDWIGQSHIAFEKLMTKLEKAYDNNEYLSITIQ